MADNHAVDAHEHGRPKNGAEVLWIDHLVQRDPNRGLVSLGLEGNVRRFPLQVVGIVNIHGAESSGKALLQFGGLQNNTLFSREGQNLQWQLDLDN